MRDMVFVVAVLLGGGAAVQAAPQIDAAGSSLIHRDGAPVLTPLGHGPAVGDGQPSVAPPPADAAARRRARLDGLFERLAKAQDQTEAAAIDGMIAQVMIQSGSDTADLLMRRAVLAMDAKDNTTALAVLDKLVELRPTWAEAWNKRATVRYLDDDDRGSMADIGRVLALEPRHFGALSGMGLILHRNGQDKSALRVFRSAAAINPQNPGVKLLIEQIVPAVEGSDL